MPITFPVHASIAVPLKRLFPRALYPAAVVVGSMIPDASYMGLPGEAHTVPGLWRYDLPAGLAGYLLLELWILPSLRRTLPVLRPRRPGKELELGRWAQTRGLPRGVLGWFLAVVSVAVGVGSHLLWDGFTHSQMWPASVLYPHVKVLGISLAALFQALFSLLGTPLLIFWGVRQTRSLPPLRELPSKSFGWVLAPFLAGLGLGLGWHIHAINVCNHWPQELWLFAWSGARGAFWGLMLGCALERLQRPVSPPSPPLPG